MQKKKNDNAKRLIAFYEEKKAQMQGDLTERLSELLNEYKEVHRRVWESSPSKGKDFEQSWKNIKGHGLEDLIVHIIEQEVGKLNLAITKGNKLGTKTTNLPNDLNKVKRHLSIDYGEHGMHLPDADLVIYEPTMSKVVAIISSKSTLRERIAQTGYWKQKLVADKLTKHIKVFFVTLDEDHDLAEEKLKSKPRAIVEVDVDGSYVLHSQVKESAKVKKFKHLISDLRRLANANES